MSDREKREKFWMEVYLKTVAKLIENSSSIKYQSISALATKIADNAVMDFRSTNVFD